jgi:hypothetical protein
MLDVTNVRGDLEVPWRIPADGLGRPAYLVEPDGSLARVCSVALHARVWFQRVTARFTQQRFGQAEVAYGHASIRGVDFFAMTAVRDGDAAMTRRVRWGGIERSHVSIPYDIEIGTPPVAIVPVRFEDDREPSVKTVGDAAYELMKGPVLGSVDPDDGLLPCVVFGTDSGSVAAIYDTPAESQGYDQFVRNVERLMEYYKPSAIAIAHESDVKEVPDPPEHLGFDLPARLAIIGAADNSGRAATFWGQLLDGRGHLELTKFSAEPGLLPNHVDLLSRGLEALQKPGAAGADI